MHIFGLEIRRASKAPPVPAVEKRIDDDRGWHTIWGGGGYTPWQMTQGFQLDLPTDRGSLERNWVVFACQTIIAGDIGKLGVGLFELKQGVWQEAESGPYDRLLRKPNGYQTWQQFIEFWSLSKQRHGNAYILLERDLATRVRAMYVLDPDRVTPLVAPDGSVYYRLAADDLAGVPSDDGQVTVPASEVIHDRFNCLFHPLIGISPLYASALAAKSGLTMQQTNELFFRNGARPGGLLTTPGSIAPTDAQRWKTEWETNFSGTNAGRTAVLGNGLKYEVIRENAVDSEVVALLKMSAEMICTTHHVPKFRVGVGEVPIQSAAETLTQVYHDTCLQTLINAIEGLIDDALGLYNVDGRRMRLEFDLNDLIRMDGTKLMEFVAKGIEKAVFSPNEGRRYFNRPPVSGGEMPMLQQQMWPIDVLKDRPPPADAGAKQTPPANEDDAAPVKGAAPVRITRSMHGTAAWYRVAGEPDGLQHSQDGVLDILVERGHAVIEDAPPDGQ